MNLCQKFKQYSFVQAVAAGQAAGRGSARVAAAGIRWRNNRYLCRLKTTLYLVEFYQNPGSR